MKRFTRFIVKRDTKCQPGSRKFTVEKMQFGILVDIREFLTIDQVKNIATRLWNERYKVTLAWDVDDVEMIDFFEEHRLSERLPRIIVSKPPYPPIRRCHGED